MSVAWQFYISTVLSYLGVDVIACWGLNLQFGVAGLVNFAFIIFQAAGAYTAAVLTLGPAKPASPQSAPERSHVLSTTALTEMPQFRASRSFTATARIALPSRV